MRFSSVFPLLLICGQSLFACKTIRDDSDLKHDPGRVKNETNPWQWQELSFADVQTYLYPDQKNALLPLNHPLVVGLQKVVDHLDRHIRSLDPSGTRDLPKPRLMVLKNPEDNALSEPVLTCLPIKMRFEGAGTAWIDRALFRRDRSEINGYGPLDQKPVCKYLQLDSQGLASLLQWELGAFPNCSFRLGAGEVIMSEGCRQWLYPGFRTIAGAKEIGLSQVSNWVTVYTGFLKVATEQEVASILAHELAHFHFAHAVARPDLYNIYYKLGSTAPLHKPVPDPILQALGQKLKKTSDLLYSEEYYAVGDRQEAAFVFGMWSRLLPSIQATYCKQKPCPAPCQDLQSQVFAPNRITAFGGFPLEELPAGAEAAWATFDRLAKNCAASISLADSQSLKPAVLQAMSEFSELCYTQIKDLPSNMALKDWLPWIENQHQTLRANLMVDYQKQARLVEAEKLGQYTFEQEADEAGLEWSVALGISPDVYLQQSVKWLKSGNDKTSTNQRPISTQKCLRYLQQDWKDDQGVPVIITPGDYAEAHQQPCYRVFSISREIKAHSYRQQGQWQTMIPNWDALVRDLAP